jgi:hypothetical protein
MVFGVVFLAIGILGFVPGVTSDDGLLLGIFQVSALHNVIHILSGVAALLAMSDVSYSRLYFRVFGAVYALVALVGWVQGTTVLGLIDVNVADNVLHTVLALMILGVGFGLPADDEVAEVRT